MLLSGKASPGPRAFAALSALNAPVIKAPLPFSSTVALPPVLEKSGQNQHWVHRRWARPHFIHQSFFEYASQSALHCPWAKLFIQDQIRGGKTHSTAVRALAFKWQRIMFVCWRDRVPYDETIYLQSLKRTGSPLATKLNYELPKAA